MHRVVIILFSVIYSTYADSVFTSTDPTMNCNADKCEVWSNWTHDQVCYYVNCNDDACEGGGYLLWSQYVECTDNAATRAIVITVAICFLIILLLMTSSAADDYFSPSISAIVAHLKISESVAGVTFMAFGNGAPDVFGSIASILSSPTPKADLALGELYGGGLFVITIVVATIVITKPFRIELFDTIRDLSFYLVTVVFLFVCFLTNDRVHLYMPLTLLGIYAVYVVTVIIGHQIHLRRKKLHRIQSKKSDAPTITITRANSVVPEVHIINDAIDKLQGYVKEAPKNEHYMKRSSISFVHSILTRNASGNDSKRGDTITTESSDDEFVVLHNHVFTGHEARSRAASLVPNPVQATSWKSKELYRDLMEHLKPWPELKEFYEMNFLYKMICMLKIIPDFLFKLTIPLNEKSWSKPLALIHAVLCPQFILFTLQVSSLQPFNGPGLWLYGLTFSAVLIGLVTAFTNLNETPIYYKETYSYLGFLMSIAWIYLTSSEIVNVVTMLGIVSRISHEILGLTILAWSNSIGDLIADISVVRQGYPRMAMAAAVGGPLFNLLMGFGLPFTIASARGKNIELALNPTYRLLMTFLLIVLTTTILGIFVQKSFLRRPFAGVLICIYLTFIVFLILSETNVLVWN